MLNKDIGAKLKATSITKKLLDVHRKRINNAEKEKMTNIKKIQSVKKQPDFDSIFNTQEKVLASSSKQSNSNAGILQENTKKSEKPSLVNKLKSKVINNNQKPKIAVCCCGFAPRSLKYTHESIETNVINVLKEDFDVDVYLYSFTSKSNIIESKNKSENNQPINNEDVNLLHNATVITRDQEEETNTIKDIITTNNIKTKNINIVNHIRQLLMLKYSFMEIHKVSQQQKINYKSIIYLEPDMFICKPISKMEVHNTILKPKNLYTCSFNDWNGYGSGFYIGSVKAMNIICDMIKGLTNDLGTDSEKLLFNTIDNSILKRVKSKMFHFKVYQDSKPNLYYQLLQKNTNSEEFIWVMNNFAKLTEKQTTKPKRSKSRRKHHKRRSCPM